LRPSTSGPNQMQSARAPGLTYDPVSKKLIGWAGGATLYGLDTQTWTWTQYVPAPSNTVTPTAAIATGTFGTFQYIPSKNAFIGVNGIYDNVYVYKLTPGIPPTITTLSPLSTSAGAAARTLTINGANFRSASTVTYKGVGHAATFVNSGQLTIQL